MLEDLKQEFSTWDVHFSHWIKEKIYSESLNKALGKLQTLFAAKEETVKRLPRIINEINKTILLASIERESKLQADLKRLHETCTKALVAEQQKIKQAAAQDRSHEILAKVLAEMNEYLFKLCLQTTSFLGPSFALYERARNTMVEILRYIEMAQDNEDKASAKRARTTALNLASAAHGKEFFSPFAGRLEPIIHALIKWQKKPCQFNWPDDPFIFLQVLERGVYGEEPHPVAHKQFMMILDTLNYHRAKEHAEVIGALQNQVKEMKERSYFKTFLRALISALVASRELVVTAQERRKYKLSTIPTISELIAAFEKYIDTSVLEGNKFVLKEFCRWCCTEYVKELEAARHLSEYKNKLAVVRELLPRNSEIEAPNDDVEYQNGLWLIDRLEIAITPLVYDEMAKQVSKWVKEKSAIKPDASAVETVSTRSLLGSNNGETVFWPLSAGSLPPVGSPPPASPPVVYHYQSAAESPSGAHSPVSLSVPPEEEEEEEIEEIEETAPLVLRRQRQIQTANH